MSLLLNSAHESYFNTKAQTINGVEEDIFSEFLHRLNNSKIHFHGTSYFTVKNFLSSTLLQEINEHWPDQDAFNREVPGNYTFRLSKSNYKRIASQHLDFWKNFNENIWPSIIASVAFRFQEQLYATFGDLYETGIEPATPLTLMQADIPYYGHEMHTHFYHDPHWAFTVLIYVDDNDTKSLGTTLHQLKVNDTVIDNNNNIQLLPLDAVVETALYKSNWCENSEKKRLFDKITIPYECGALLAFIDGPLSFHSVEPHDRDTSDANIRKKRRILRAHIKVSKIAFFREMRYRTQSDIHYASFFRCTKYATRENKGNYAPVFKNSAFNNVKRIYELSIIDRLCSKSSISAFSRLADPMRHVHLMPSPQRFNYQEPTLKVQLQKIKQHLGQYVH